jgi:hypothetical protein
MRSVARVRPLSCDGNEIFTKTAMEGISEFLVPGIGLPIALTGGYANGGSVKAELLVRHIVRTGSILKFPGQRLMTSLVR